MLKMENQAHLQTVKAYKKELNDIKDWMTSRQLELSTMTSQTSNDDISNLQRNLNKYGNVSEEIGRKVELLQELAG